jgi:DNA-binding HxlR family transcriptional regulator
MANGTDNFAEDQRRAEVFDALSHPTRILILKALSQEPQGFADLKKKLGIDSSGHLQHHLNKLSGLVKTDYYGKYILSDEGRDALVTVETVEKATKPEPSSNRSHPTVKSIVWKAAALALVLALALSLTYAMSQQLALDTRVLSLEETLRSRDFQVDHLSQNVTRLRQLVTALEGVALQMDNAIGYSQAVLGTRKPAPQNLTCLSDGKATKISLLSTDLGYCYAPNPMLLNATYRQTLQMQVDNRTIGMPVFGYSYAPGNYTWLISGMEDSRGYLMIGATIRNDYAPSDATNRTDTPISNLRGTYRSYVGLSVKLLRQDGSEVPANNLNFTYAQNYTNMGNKSFILESGATTQVTFYLTPATLDFDRYEVCVSSLTAFPPP